VDLTVANAVKRVFESVNATFSSISVYRSVDKLYYSCVEYTQAIVLNTPIYVSGES
jgi:hypothetical protein